MEKDSLNSLADFEFKYIPQQEFEKIVMKVREKKTQEAWTSFCLKQPESDKISKVKASKILNGDEIQSVIGSLTQSDTPRTPAPFFGPARKYDISASRSNQEKSKFSCDKSDKSSEASTVHIVEDFFEANEIKTQVEDDDASDSTITDDENSLHNEMMKLCYEIEGVNGGQASDNDDSSVDLNFQEEKHLRNIMDKTEEKVICETYGKIIDKKFDFLYDEFKNSDDEALERAQTLPAVELKPKNKNFPTGGDLSDDNNVWRPKAENQIRRKTDVQRERTKKNDSDVFPSDVVIRKARDVGKLKQVANEKPQEYVERLDKLQKEEISPSKVDILAALGRITDYQRKIIQCIDFLREIVEDPPEVEDMDDLKRRQKRATEFSNRFARNHLYQIGRIAEEIRLMPDNPMDVATKVNALFQTIMQAVQIYLKNVEMFIYNSYPDKLLVLVDFVINATKICFDRMVFDKKDTVVIQMLKRCSGLKEFLERNQRSLAKFSSIAEQRKKSLHSRNSFSFEVPQASKLSMYNAPSYGRQRNKSAFRQMPAKSPYDAQPRLRNLKTSQSFQGQQPKAPSRQQSRIKSPNLKKTSSNISTMMERMNQKEAIKTMPEKPLENSQRAQTSKENELRELLMNVAEEKISQLLMPLIEQFKSAQQSLFDSPKFKVREKNVEDEGSEEECCGKTRRVEYRRNIEGGEDSEKRRTRLNSEGKSIQGTSDIENSYQKPRIANFQRVTSDVGSSQRVTSEVQKHGKMKNREDFPPAEPKHIRKAEDKVERIAKNIQYIYVKSEDEGSEMVDSSLNRSRIDLQELLEKSPSKSQLTTSSKSKLTSSDIKLTSTKPQQTSSQQQLTPSKPQKTPSNLHQAPSFSNSTTSAISNSPKILTSKSKPPIPFGNTSKSDDEIYFKKMKALAMKERLNYIEQQSQNPLYVNEACNEPWKLVANISDNIVDDVLQNVLAGLDFGEKIFVEKFLRSELS